MPIRVVIAEDSLIVRKGIEQLLACEDELVLVASCSDLPQLEEAVEREAPDVVLTDSRMPPAHDDEGLRVAAWLREAHPEIGVIVLSQYADPEFALKLLEAGSDGRGYLLKERIHDAAQLRAAIEAVAQGGSVIDSKLVDALFTSEARVERSLLADLTVREREVLAELAQGKSNAAIARSLVLTKGAIEKHTNSIFLKLGVAGSEDVSKRVTAALVFLAARRTA